MRKWEEYKDEGRLADEIGCNPSLVRRWLWNRHAQIGEMAELIDAENEMEVLSRLKAINSTLGGR